MAKGNAGDWTPADAIAQEAELAGISNPSSTTRVETHRTFVKDQDEAQKLLAVAAKACKNAGKGALAEIKKVRGGYNIIITEPKGKKK